MEDKTEPLVEYKFNDLINWIKRLLKVTNKREEVKKLIYEHNIMHTYSTGTDTVL